MTRVALMMLAILGLALAGCGFQLRGQAQLPFIAAYVDAPPDSVMAGRLRGFLSQEAKLAERRDAADTVIRLTGENRIKSILSLSGAGKVREYRLTHKVTVSAVDPAGKEMLTAAEIVQTRDFSYSDEQMLAKEAEEAMLHRDMDENALRQIVRRLAFIHKP